MVAVVCDCVGLYGIIRSEGEKTNGKVQQEKGKRGEPTTEFMKDGKPQVYCRGWIDSMTDEPLDECRKCLDWVNGKQCDMDSENAILDFCRKNKGD